MNAEHRSSRHGVMVVGDKRLHRNIAVTKFRGNKTRANGVVLLNAARNALAAAKAFEPITIERHEEAKRHLIGDLHAERVKAGSHRYRCMRERRDHRWRINLIREIIDEVNTEMMSIDDDIYLARWPPILRGTPPRRGSFPESPEIHAASWPPPANREDFPT